MPMYSDNSIVTATVTYLEREILPKLRGRRIVSKPLVEDLLNQDLPEFLKNRQLRNRRAIVTKALDQLLPRKWSDSAWVLEGA